MRLFSYVKKKYACIFYKHCFSDDKYLCGSKFLSMSEEEKDGESGRSAYARRGMRNHIIYRAKILKTEDYCGIPRVSTPPNLGNSRNVTVPARLP